MSDIKIEIVKKYLLKKIVRFSREEFASINYKI